MGGSKNKMIHVCMVSSIVRRTSWRCSNAILSHPCLSAKKCQVGLFYVPFPAGNLSSLPFFFFFVFEYFIYLFLERGKGDEKERERSIIVWLPVMHPPTGDQAHNPGMCPDWNWWPFSSQASTQSSEPHQPGPIILLTVTLPMGKLPTNSYN